MIFCRWMLRFVLFVRISAYSLSFTSSISFRFSAMYIVNRNTYLCDQSTGSLTNLLLPLMPCVHLSDLYELHRAIFVHHTHHPPAPLRRLFIVLFVRLPVVTHKQERDSERSVLLLVFFHLVKRRQLVSPHRINMIPDQVASYSVYYKRICTLTWELSRRTPSVKCFGRWSLASKHVLKMEPGVQSKIRRIW